MTNCRDLGGVIDEGLLERRQEVFRRNPYRAGNRILYYASAIGTEPAFADIILDTVARFDAAHCPKAAV